MPKRDDMPLVSVIIPTHNRSKLLRLTLESVLAQTYPAVEIIVVDDGSTDNTVDMMEQYRGRATYIRQAKQGDWAARNTGLRAASGDYINFLDDDDLLMPTKLELQVKVFDSRPEFGIANCGYYYIDLDGNMLEKSGPIPEGDVLKELIHHCFPVMHAPLVRRALLDQVGLFEKGIAPDWNLWLSIARAGYQFLCVQEPLCAHRIVPGSLVTNPARFEQVNLAVLDRAFSDPRLPADVAAMKEQVYGDMRFHISCRYYAAGFWEEAQRNLLEALVLRPQFLERPGDFLDPLCGYALGVRTDNPVKFIADVFEHLPPDVENLGRYRLQALSQTHVGLALRRYAAGDIAEAKSQLARAVALDPAMLERPEAFAGSICHYALRAPVDVPPAFAETVLQNLPAEAQQLKRVRAQVLGNVNIASAFQDYHAGHRRLVARQVLAGLRHRPAWLGNRGVVSIFVKSLLGGLIGEHGIQR